MQNNKLREIWKSGGNTINGWLGLPNNMSAEVVARAGFEISDEVLRRDPKAQYAQHPSVLEAFKKVYRDPDAHYAEYEMAEKLVDLEEQFALWRFRHLKTVERIIGYKTGTGGSPGVPFLRKLVEHVFFPELWAVRTEL